MCVCVREICIFLRLLVLEDGGALLDEGSHTLLLVGGGEGELESTLLVGEALGEG